MPKITGKKVFMTFAFIFSLYIAYITGNAIGFNNGLNEISIYTHTILLKQSEIMRYQQKILEELNTELQSCNQVGI